MTANDIKEMLNDKIGAKAGTFGYEVFNFVKKAFPISLAKNLYYEEDRNTVYVKYGTNRTNKYSGIIVVKVIGHRKKGQSHYKYGQSWTDYTFKDFEVEVNTDDGVVESIFTRLIGEDKRVDENFRKYAEYIRQFKEITGVSSDRDVRDICSFIASNFYKIEEYSEK